MTTNQVKEKAIAHLKARYAEAKAKYPSGMIDISEDSYVRVNLAYAMRNIRDRENFPPRALDRNIPGS